MLLRPEATKEEGEGFSQEYAGHDKTNPEEVVSQPRLDKLEGVGAVVFKVVRQFHGEILTHSLGLSSRKFTAPREVPIPAYFHGLGEFTGQSKLSKSRRVAF